MDIKNASLRLQLPGADPDPHLPTSPVRAGAGRLSLTLEVEGRPELAAAIAEAFRSQPGSLAWLVLLYRALVVEEPGQDRPPSIKGTPYPRMARWEENELPSAPDAGVAS